MNIADIMRPNGKIYLRPEFGRIGKHWPCIAFRLMLELLKLVDVYEDGDLILGTGTVNAENTREPTYRGKILTGSDGQAAIFSYTGNCPGRELGSSLPGSMAGKRNGPTAFRRFVSLTSGRNNRLIPKAKSFMPITYPALSRAVKTVERQVAR